VEFVVGFAWPVWDCSECGCRFTRHEHKIYNALHSQPGSCYSRYRDIASAVKPIFDRGDIKALHGQLSQAAKYRFIIDELGNLNQPAKFLEVGCARGFLTSYFILGGYDILGVDVSEEAINSAVAMFGNHFALSGAAAMETHAPYDAIYHVGTIGCVADPVGMTEQLLGLLKPGGRLLFNAPNRSACNQRGQLWFDSTPPPDLVTLFRPGFWRKRFGQVAEVEEEIEPSEPERSFTIGLRNLFRIRWQHPEPIQLNRSAQASMPSRDGKLWEFFERATRKVARTTRLINLVPRQPSEYDFFVTMKRK
jgi:SAM-dependent methyltransferase